MLNLSSSDLRRLPGAIYNGIRDLAQGKPLSGLAKDISESNQSVLERHGLVSRSSFEMNIDIGDLFRAANTGTFSSGGAFVGTDVDLQAIEPALRASSVTVAAGARVLTGLTKNYAVPVERTPSSFSWYPESVSTDFSQSDPVAGQANMTPYRAAAATSLSNQASTQAGPLLAEFLISSLSTGLGVLADAALLAGTGVGGQPLGVVNRPGVSSITAGGAMTFAKLCEANGYENTLLDANVPPQNLRWIAHPNVKAKFKTVAKFSSDAGAGALWEVDRDEIGGHQAFTTTSLSATTGLILGDWTKAIIGWFGPGVKVLVSPYSLSMSDKISIVVSALLDVSVTKAECFAIAGDSAVQ